MVRGRVIVTQVRPELRLGQGGKHTLMNLEQGPLQLNFRGRSLELLAEIEAPLGFLVETGLAGDPRNQEVDPEALGPDRQAEVQVLSGLDKIPLLPCLFRSAKVVFGLEVAIGEVTG